VSRLGALDTGRGAQWTRWSPAGWTGSGFTSTWFSTARSCPRWIPPSRGGLTYYELSEVLGAAAASPLAVGVEITIFDPDLDPSGTLARQLMEALVAGFRAAGR
jgi:hypothetical protein